MGRILDNGPIGAITFEKPKKGQIYKGCEFVRISGTTVVIKKSNGAFVIAGSQWESGVSGNYAVRGFGATDLGRTVLRALVRLGALTKADVDKHIEHETEQRDRRNRRMKEETIARYCAELGVEVPVEIADAINSANERGAA